MIADEVFTGDQRHHVTPAPGDTARPGDGRADTPTLDISRLDTRPALDTRGCLGAVQQRTARCVVLDDILIPCLSTTTTTKTTAI